MKSGHLSHKKMNEMKNETNFCVKMFINHQWLGSIFGDGVLHPR